MDDFERRDGDDAPPEGIPSEPPNMEPELASDDTPRLGMIALDSVLEPDGELALTPDATMDSLLEPSISQKAKRKPDGHEARIEVLSLAIERYPNAAVNYVLRGEAWLAVGNRANALSDFRAALALASDASDTARWGYVEQALADRACEGLRQLGM